MKVTFEDQTNRITHVRYKALPNYPVPFSNATFGSFQGRSLIMGGDFSNQCLEWYDGSECFEFDQEEYHFIPSLNVNRESAASTFIQNKVVVAGGSRYNDNDKGSTKLDTIEILDWHESNHGSQWIQSPSRLPIKVKNHTLVTLNDKLYLIGGAYGPNILDILDTIWEGSFDKQSNNINWVETGLRLQKKRSRHFSFVISNQIIIFGGENVDDDFVEIIENNELKQGPKVPPFELSTWYDQAVLDRKNRIIITSRDHGLIIYDHTERKFTPNNNFELREERRFYAAILQ